MFRLSVVLAVVAGLVIACVPALAGTWDVSTDFSSVSNPTAAAGGWTYGYEDTLGGTLTNYDNVVAPPGVGSTFGKDSIWWRAGSESLEWGFAHGNVALATNTTAENNNACWVEPGMVLMSPNDTGTGRPTVARWTSNITGTVTISARFSGQYFWLADDPNSAAATRQDMTVYILKDGNAVSPVFSGNVHGFGGTVANGYADHSVGSVVQNYTGTIEVAQGTTIDFVRTAGWNGGFMGLSATIASPDVPEPNGLLLFGTLIGGGVLTTIRRRISR